MPEYAKEEAEFAQQRVEYLLASMRESPYKSMVDEEIKELIKQRAKRNAVGQSVKDIDQELKLKADERDADVLVQTGYPSY